MEEPKDVVEATTVVLKTPPKRRCRCASFCRSVNSDEEREPLLAIRYSRNGDRGEDAEDDSSYTGTGAHCHTVQKREVSPVDKKARRQLITASVLCLLFMLAEIVGGVLANSLAIATDAAHLLTDFASFMISLFSLYLASRPATKRMSFGWHRAEVMGATISVLLIWVVTGVLVYMAVERVMSKEYEINATIMLITAAVGVAVNIVMGITLGHGHSHGGSHGHSHAGGGSHSHEHTGGTNAEEDISAENSPHLNTSKNSTYGAVSSLPENSEQNASNTDAGAPQTTDRALGSPSVISRTISICNGSSSSSVASVRIELDHSDEAPATKHTHKGDDTNINVRAAFIHVLGDLLQSVGILIAAVIIYYKPEWKIADPICTFIFSVLVLFTTITILRDTLNVLMEGTPRGISFKEVKASLCSITGVKELHNLRLWSLTMNKTAVSVHLALEEHGNAQHVLSEAGTIMTEKYGVYECTVQIENYVDEMTGCTHCQDPLD